MLQVDLSAAPSDLFSNVIFSLQFMDKVHKIFKKHCGDFGGNSYFCTQREISLYRDSSNGCVLKISAGYVNV